jgi:hypothetical protein
MYRVMHKEERCPRSCAMRIEYQSIYISLCVPTYLMVGEHPMGTHGEDSRARYHSPRVREVCFHKCGAGTKRETVTMVERVCGAVGGCGAAPCQLQLQFLRSPKVPHARY